MPRLVPPTTEVRESFLAAMQEFRAEGRGVPSDQSEVSYELQNFGGAWSTPAGFAEYVERLIADSKEETPRPDGWVPQTSLWYVEDDEYYGRLSIRHRLTPLLRDVGGHIGYDVRRSARRRGYATRMLRDALPVARELGIDSVLITCDVDNVASRRVIEKNGGVMEDQRGVKLRFWVPTEPQAR